ncbi:MAG: MFS transporter [Actinomycetaceae bacterium]|nr:MFS transporter [Actinomycetaceae bacterium]
MSNTPKADTKLPASAQAPLLYAILMLALMGQMLLSPIIAPLAREMGLAEWHIGLTISLAAIMLAFTSGPWGRASQVYGVRPILTTAMSLGAIALGVFALIAHYGMRGIWAGTALALGVVLTRGILYGCAISALNPTIQTHLVTHTTTEAQRVKAVGGMGAVTGLSSVIGAVVGGSLAAIGGLMMPLTVMPLLMVAGVVVLWVKFKETKALSEVEKPVKLSYFDSRAFPFLVVGLLLFIVFGALGVIFGFLIQDRFALDARTTASVTAAYMVGLSIALIVAQAIAAPKLGWNSVQLLRRGVAITALAVAVILPAHSYTLMAIGTILFGFGGGLMMPGYNAGPTIHMSNREQGSLAGLINANNGLAYAIAPVTFTALYGWSPYAALGLGLALLIVATTFAYLHPTLRKLAQTTQPAVGEGAQ